jgi:hypothetical protein
VKRAPFFFEVTLALAFAAGVGVGAAATGAIGGLEACASGAPPIVSDAFTIEAKDAACILTHIAEPDAVIIAACSPAGDAPKAQAIAVTVTLCRAAKAVTDGGAVE